MYVGIQLEFYLNLNLLSINYHRNKKKYASNFVVPVIVSVNRSLRFTGWRHQDWNLK